MKKLVVLTIVVIVVVGLVGVFLVKFLNDSEDIEKPPIVDHFACSDYCPGDHEDYVVKIYQGIEDEEECLELGGTPSSYSGWGTTKICIAE